MAGQSSIVARLGLDVKSLDRDFSQAEKLAIRASNNMAAAGEKATGLQLAGTGKVKRNIAGLTQTILSGGSAYDILAQAAIKAANSFRFGLGAAATVAIAAVAYKTVKDAIDKTTQAGKELHTELNKPIGDGLNAEGLQGKIEGIQEKLEELKKSRGIISSIFATVTGKTPALNREEDAAELRKLELGKTLVNQVREQIEARQFALHTSQREAELLESQRKTREKIASLDSDAKLNPNVRTSLKLEASAEGQEQEEQINRKFDAKERELGLENELNNIKDAGVDLELNSARVRLEYAQKELKVAADYESTREAAQKVREAEAAYRLAQRTTQELREQQRIEIQTSGLSEEERRRSNLESEKSDIAARLSNPKTPADEKEKLKVDRARNAASLKDLDLGDAEKSFGIARSQIDAQTGPGQAAQFQALQQKIALGASQVTLLQSLGASPEKIAAATAELKNLANEYQKTIEARKRATKEASEETAILRLRLQHEDHIADALQTQLDFRRRIAELRKAGENQNADELQKQSQLTLQKQAQDIADKNADRGKASLGELATHAHNAQGRDAREAQRLEKRADRERQRGHSDAATLLQNRADAIKKGIPGLKSTEKNLTPDGVAKGIDSSKLAEALKKLADDIGAAK